MSAKKQIFFNIAFWLIAISLLFINALPAAKMHMDVAIFRYSYLFIVAMVLCLALAWVYGTDKFSQQKHKLVWVFLASAVAALVTSLLVNPVTFFMAGTDIRTMPGRVFSTGVLLTGLLYFIWSLMSLQMTGHALFKTLRFKPGSKLEDFKVEKRGEKRSLPIAQVCSINAKGDYVELSSETETYLIKHSIASLEKLLDPENFKRIHRSTIVNRQKISSVKAKTGGVFEIYLKNGKKVTSSRSFKAVVRDLFPEG